MRLNTEMKNKIAKLSARERKYFNVMNGKNGVLFVTSRPGEAKSSIMRSIADKLDMQYIDIRLSMIDETEVGLFPTLQDLEVGTENGKPVTQKFLDFVTPKWAWKANQRPTLIHFEEGNRCSLNVRNAALQILNERQIGSEFKFNDNVFMVMSGNLGESDSCDVEEFDGALNNRLIHLKHEITLDEWIEEYAKNNVHPIIVEFLKVEPGYFYKAPESDSQYKAFATPRSWSFLSSFITENFGTDEKNGMDASPQEFLSSLEEVGFGYVGAAYQRFRRFCEDMMAVNIDVILNDFDGIASKLKTFNRDRKSELLSQLKQKDLESLKKKQVDNLIKFLKLVSSDERIAYFIEAATADTTDENDKNSNILKLRDAFLEDFKMMIERYEDLENDGE
jgi:hypothetical protein